MTSHFEGFKGFYPEDKFEAVSKLPPREVAIQTLKLNKGRKAEITYNPVIYPHGINKYEGIIIVPVNDRDIESCIAHYPMDHITIDFIGSGKPAYTFQQIVIGEEKITEIDRY
jgi:hypothetical protein